MKVQVPRDVVLVLVSDKLFAVKRIQDLGLEPVCLTTPSYQELYCDAFATFLVDSMEDMTSLLSIARRVLETHQVRHVVALSEKTIFPASLLRTMFGFPGLQVEAGLRFTNKLAMKTALAKATVPVVEFSRLDSLRQLQTAPNKVGLPVVLKPVFGSGSKNTVMLRDRTDLETFVTSEQFASLQQKSTTWMIESMVTDLQEYHVDAIIESSTVVWRLASRYFVPVVQSRNRFGGSIHLSPEAPESSMLFRLCDESIRVFGLDNGVVHLEVLRQDNRYWLGEVACRPAGAGIPLSVQRFFGIDLWDAYLKLALSIPLTLPLPVPHRKLVCGWVKLPLQQGRITKLVSTEELLSLPYVVQVEFLVSTGDQIDIASSHISNSGFLLLEADSQQQLIEGFEIVQSTFRLETSIE